MLSVRCSKEYRKSKVSINTLEFCGVVAKKATLWEEKEEEKKKKKIAAEKYF